MTGSLAVLAQPHQLRSTSSVLRVGSIPGGSIFCRDESTPAAPKGFQPVGSSLAGIAAAGGCLA